MRSDEIRETFLKYFEKQGHTRVASASLIPAGDPTLYFTNAGMVPFKDVFLGAEKRLYKRAASSQKCMRVSGKHNDLENVGYTPRHHTFFEMLGNFSFGDYFKKEAIAFAWEFLTKVLKLDKNRLLVTVFEKDDDAAALWLQHVSKDSIFRLGEKDNFWAMGDTGPCGPCSEIHWDRDPGKPVTQKEVEAGERFFELWNLVFMQFNRGVDGALSSLPKPSVDTGMGLERLACVMQKVDSNWETDLFVPIIKTIESIAGVTTSFHGAQDERVIIAMRVIADHVRAATFLIADGLFPSNEGRGYVLRRILRRAIRYARQLEIHQPFFAAVSRTVRNEMGKAYPEIVQHQSMIDKILTHEEERFLETLDRGLEILEKEFVVLQKSRQKNLHGEIVFKLYDTFGFPKDLTELIARERGWDIDEKGFEAEMEKQRERARKAWKGSGAIKMDPIYQKIKQEGCSTDFIGYEKESAEGEVLRLVKGGKVVTEAKEGETIELITDVTPFYAEGGGQVGDTGLGVQDETELQIEDTQKPFSDLFVHWVKVISGALRRDQRLLLQINSERRQQIRCNHTATHLLHAALRQILGEHVKQAGSYLDDKYLRFDFSHFGSISDEQLADIEMLVNKEIEKNISIKTSVLSYHEAIAQGALAYFGEKYGDRVRMVDIKDFSKELCGGTHVAATGEIGLVKLVKERSVASGVRRIEAISGMTAQVFLKADQTNIKEKEANAKKKEILKQREKTEKSSRLQQAVLQFDTWVQKAREVKGVKILAAQVEAANAQELREMADTYKQKLGSGIIVLGADVGGKAALVAAVTSDLVSRFSAGDIMKKLAPRVGGTGGGRADMAQGGGPSIDKLNDILSMAWDILSER